MKEIRESYIKYIADLNGEYEKKFALVDTYCTYLLDGVDINTKEEIMSSILDSFLSAQAEGVPIDTVIGNDIAKFCENACSEIPFKYRIKRIVQIVAVYSIVQIPLILINIFMDIFGGTKNFDNLLYWETNIDFLIFYPLFTLVLIIYLKLRKRQLRREVQKGRINPKSETISIIVFLLLFFLTCGVISEINISLSIWIVFSILLFFVILSKILYLNDAKYDMDITESFAKAIILESNDTFKKINEKRIKKGKPAFSEEQYLDYSIKQCKKELNRIKLYISLFLVIALPLSLLGESFLDKLSIFGMMLALFLLFELPAYWFGRGIRKINKILLKKYTYFKENNILMKDWK